MSPTPTNPDETIEEIPNVVRLGKINGTYVYKGGGSAGVPRPVTSGTTGSTGATAAAPSANISGGTVYVFESAKGNRIVRKAGAKSAPAPVGGVDPMNNPYAASSRPNLPSMVGTRAPNGSN